MAVDRENQKDEPKQKTPHGHEIPVPTREEFLHDLKKVVKPSDPKRRPKK